MINDINVKMGRVLRNLREERGLSQEKLAEAVGSSQRHISRLETGQSPIMYKLMGKICGYFKIPPKYLFDFDEKNIACECLYNEVMGTISSFGERELEFIKNMINEYVKLREDIQVK